MIRLVVADDQPVVRSGLRMILEAQSDLEVVGEASDGREAVELVAALDPDVALIDIRMPVVDGIEATRRIARSGAACRVLILTTYALNEYVYDALKSGAAGFALKSDSPERLVEAVRAVAGGETLLAPEITRRLIDSYVTGPRPNGDPPPELDSLTAKEREVLGLVAEGRSNAEIAAALFVSDGTVKTHVTHILTKLGLRDRVQAVVFAYECGLVRPGR